MAVPYLASIAITDATGDRKTMQVYFDPTTATLAQITTWLQNLALVVDAVSDGVIESMSLTLAVTLPGGLDTAPTGDVDIERGALIGFDASGTPYRHSVWIPAFSTTMFTGDLVDFSNAGVQALDDYLTTTVTGITASDKFGNHLVAPLSGVKSF